MRENLSYQLLKVLSGLRLGEFNSYSDNIFSQVFLDLAEEHNI